MGFRTGNMFVYFYFLTYVHIVVMHLKERSHLLLIYYYHVTKQHTVFVAQITSHTAAFPPEGHISKWRPLKY